MCRSGPVLTHHSTSAGLWGVTHLPLGSLWGAASHGLQSWPGQEMRLRAEPAWAPRSQVSGWASGDRPLHPASRSPPPRFSRSFREVFVCPDHSGAFLSPMTLKPWQRHLPPHRPVFWNLSSCLLCSLEKRVHSPGTGIAPVGFENWFLRLLAPGPQFQTHCSLSSSLAPTRGPWCHLL